MSGTSIIIGKILCFRQGHLKSVMFCEVESNVKMMRCRLQDKNGEGETGEQGEAANLDDSGGRVRLLCWRRLEGRARLLGWRRLVQGEAVRLKKVVDG